MQSSSMVGIVGRDDRFEAQLQHHHHQKHHLSHQRVRAHDSTALTTSPAAASQYPNHPYDYSSSASSYHHRASAPQSPPSPPGEDTIKPSLPSISSLLGMTEGNQNQQTMQQQTQPEPAHTQQPVQNTDYRPVTATHPSYAPTTAGHGPKVALPPTPPMGPDVVIDGNQSPSAMSQSSMSAAPYYLGQHLNNMDPHQHQSLQTASLPKRSSLPTQASPYTTSPYSTNAYTPSPASMSAGPYYTPESQVVPSSGLYHQRPLPSNFPPQVNVAVAAQPAQNAANPWQHHHYISASSQASFPQSQDRYICPTCNKAFSRPSSLRIHSHSHTGEKPFKCSHAGCGKAFSVRSNMKRHERGCHAIASSTVQSSS